MAKNIDVINAFINGDSKPKTKNLRIEGNKLFNYSTVIAERDSANSYSVNLTKYSQSTSTIQNQLVKALKYELGEHRYEVGVVDVYNVPMGAKNLYDDEY